MLEKVFLSEESVPPHVEFQQNVIQRFSLHGRFPDSWRNPNKEDRRARAPREREEGRKREERGLLSVEQSRERVFTPAESV